MRQVWLLTKVQLGSVFGLFKRSRNRARKNNPLVMVLLFLFFTIILAYSSFIYSYALGMSLSAVDSLDLLPQVMMAATCIVTLLTTIYKVKGTLFGFKDYDLIMALPVKTSRIAASRLLLLYLVNISFTLMIMLPADIAYATLKSVSLWFYVSSLLLVFFIPLFPMIIATVIGTVITVIAARFRQSNVVNIIITLFIFSAYMIFSFRTSNSVEAMGEMGKMLSNRAQKVYPLAGMYQKAVCEFDIVSIILFLGISIISFLLFAWAVGLKFKRINTMVASYRAKSNYRIKNIKTASPFVALYKKELKRYFSSSLYVMNTAFGIVMMTIAAVAVIIMSPKEFVAVLEMPELSGSLVFLLSAAISFCVAMSNTAACSISLEGKNLWILKALPVSVNMVLFSKIAINLTITLPFVLLDSLIIALGLRVTGAEFFILLFMPVVYALFTPVLGLIINLKFPNFTWTTEVMVIKQSAAMMIAVFTGLFVGAIPFALIILLSGRNAFYIDLVVALALLTVTFVLFAYLKKEGGKIFLRL